ncbi:aldolase catalytic domain-containing protein [Marinimicrobium sp. ABcell2]|uniref:aldolase catalytic domain-containing protein n=1 Tax=Marinimicrobium sp. ABcell2 TaxID=3069751 RepID=UPI0027B00925|nr:aldolase catalytic domain-containing protein [Marinimicrobium sp. ABcell2]MDQ2078327.1 aldolase catalytic domain-containing protein [Marinimicrobium sp. ABcell2]
MKVLDCTLRDGGYYNNWNFTTELANDYLKAMQAARVDVVELGLRSLINKGFKGPNAFTTEAYLDSLDIPAGLSVAVMVNATELVGEGTQNKTLAALFPFPASESKVDVVRIACHVHEFKEALPASKWLKDRGFAVGFNLMQVADRSRQEIEALAQEASQYPLDVLYFADSMGSMTPADTLNILNAFRVHWSGPMGVHTHDNKGLALQNTLTAYNEGVEWLDATVTGMGRGPGNARTEELVIEAAEIRNSAMNLVPLMTLIRQFFQPLKAQCGWGSNPYYYLSGKYGIHPTYIQEMLGDSRYSEEDVLATIEHLKTEGGKKFSFNTLDATRNFYVGQPRGSWRPADLFAGREVLLLGTGPGVAEHRKALEAYIKHAKPIVVAMNTQSAVSQSLIDVRIACHPVRLLADCDHYAELPQPLITPASMLREDVRCALGDKKLLDYGLAVEEGCFSFNEYSCVLPSSLVVCYALAVLTSGNATRILMAGFDGYSADDPRNAEMNTILGLYQDQAEAKDLLSITETRYDLPAKSVYGLAG